MSRIWVYLGLAVGVTALAVVPIAWASSPGAPTGRSGGPAANGTFCNTCHGPFRQGTGFVDVLGAPTRYRAGNFYDLTVRITAPDQDGAGFELSAETPFSHAGALALIDGTNTQFADGLPDYVTHTSTGLANSRADWVGNGGSYEYNLRWQAPLSYVGPVTFYASVNAVDDAEYFTGVRYYRGYARTQFAELGDVDGDTDVDLVDHALQADCMMGPGVPRGAACEFADFDGDGDVDLVDIAKSQTKFSSTPATDPPAFVLADGVRGGVVYDKWWIVNGTAEPTGDHPLYPAIGQKSGSTTHRCKECHGWDYKGVNGAYGSGTSFTGIGGVFGSTLTAQEMFDLLASADTLNDGHDMLAFGMSEGDLWDVVKMVIDGTVDTDTYIVGTGPETGTFIGDESNGQFTYGTSNFDGACATCHTVDGTGIAFHGGGFVGTVANANPWELLHKVRFGHPGAPMPSFELLGWSPSLAADVGKHAATLPQ